MSLGARHPAIYSRDPGFKRDLAAYFLISLNLDPGSHAVNVHYFLQIRQTAFVRDDEVRGTAVLPVLFINLCVDPSGFIRGIQF